MKKICKILLSAAGLAVCLEAANRAIFAAAQRSARPAARFAQHIYKWKFGRIRYITAGDEALPPLLLVHGVGVGAGLHEWEASIEALSKHYRVYTLDLLGFGASEKTALTVSSYLYAVLINDFISCVIKEDAFVVANNMSCSFAAVASQLSPANFTKFLFISPYAVTPPHPCAKQAWLKKLLECPVVGTSIYLAMSARCALQARGLNGRKADVFYTAAHLGGANARYPLASLLTGFLYIDTKRALGMVTHPVKYLWADGTRLYPHADEPKALYHACRQFFR